MTPLAITLILIAAVALAPLCKHADQWIKRHIIVSRRLKAAGCWNGGMTMAPVWGL